MRIRTIVTCLFAALAVSGETRGAQAASELVEAVQTALYAGRTVDAAAAAEGRLAEAPDDDQARFALGVVQFLQAVEHLGQSLHRHGLASGEGAFGGMAELPFLRVPVPQNANPEPLTYEGFRGILEAFVNDLQTSETTVAGVESEAIDLPLNLGLIRLDLNGDGQGSEGEALWRVFREIAGLPWIDEQTASQLLVDFDSSDAPWLQAYCHLLMAIAEFPLAHDWRAAFETTFHGVFPNAGLPSSALNADTSATTPSDFRSYASVVDLVAFIHLNHWPVVEPERMTSVLAHLEAVPQLSRKNWRLILAETDRRREWIPSPKQSGVVPEIQVTQEQLDGWMMFLDEFEALLEGEKLLPHWRFERGINLRRIFTEPTTFDLVLLIQGSAALPYLEEGELTTDETWRRISQLLDGNLFRYTVWFN